MWVPATCTAWRAGGLAPVWRTPIGTVTAGHRLTGTLCCLLNGCVLCVSLSCAAGLVDAVQALQQRNRLLQQDLDTLKVKYTGAEGTLGR